MKENLKNLVLLFSLILNIAFLGATVYYKLSTPSAACTLGTGPYLYQELNLTQAQLLQIEPIRDRFHAQVGQIGSNIKLKQLQIIDSLASPASEIGAVNSLQKETLELQQKMQNAIINHFVEETKIFTPEQRKNFFKLIKDRIEQSSQPCPPWMRSSGKSLSTNKQ